jgi:hypothetical protein
MVNMNPHHARGAEELQEASWARVMARRCNQRGSELEPTFIFANVLESERAVGVFAFDYADFAKCALANNAEEAEMVEVD